MKDKEQYDQEVAEAVQAVKTRYPDIWADIAIFTMWDVARMINELANEPPDRVLALVK